MTVVCALQVKLQICKTAKNGLTLTDTSQTIEWANERTFQRLALCQVEIVRLGKYSAAESSDKALQITVVDVKEKVWARHHCAERFWHTNNDNITRRPIADVMQGKLGRPCGKLSWPRTRHTKFHYVITWGCDSALSNPAAGSSAPPPSKDWGKSPRSLRRSTSTTTSTFFRQPPSPIAVCVISCHW